MIDFDCALRQPPESLFLNRFFPEPDTQATENGSTPRTPDVGNFKDFPALANERNRSKRPAKRTNVQFQTYGPDFKTEIQKDRMRLSNYREIKLFARGRTVNPGMKIQIPNGFFGLINCMNPPGCVCMTDTLNSGPVDVRPYLVNISNASIEIHPLTLQIYVHVLPKLTPEPWQTVNLPAPHSDEAYFDLRTRYPFTFPPRSTSYLSFNATHLCPQKTHTALIVARRQLTQRKLLIETTVWAPETTPVVRAINASHVPIHVPAGTKAAKVFFTAPGIKPYSPSLTSLVTSLNIPRINVSLTRTTPTYRQKRAATPRTKKTDTPIPPPSTNERNHNKKL